MYRGRTPGTVPGSELAISNWQPWQWLGWLWLLRFSCYRYPVALNDPRMVHRGRSPAGLEQVDCNVEGLRTHSIIQLQISPYFLSSKCMLANWCSCDSHSDHCLGRGEDAAGGKRKIRANRAKRWDGNGEERRIGPVRVPTGNRRNSPMRMICRGFFHRGQGQWQWVGKRRNSEQETAELLPSPGLQGRGERLSGEDGHTGFPKRSSDLRSRDSQPKEVTEQNQCLDLMVLPPSDLLPELSII